jgi:hypothetical protein
MLEPKSIKTKSLASKFILSQEEKTKLLEDKIKRAEAHIKVLAEITKKLERK